MIEDDYAKAVAEIAVPESPQPLDEAIPAWAFARAIAQLPAAVCITDADARILYANPAFTEITGYSVSEVIGQNTSILAHECTPPRVYEQMWDRLVHARPWTGLLVNRRKYGAVYLAELTVAPLLDAQDRAVYYLGMHRDVTAVHRLEQQVHNQKELIESMVDAAPAVIALLNGSGQVILQNHEYKQLAAAMQGKEPAVELLHGLRESLGESFQHHDGEGESFRNKEVSFEPGGDAPTRWFSCSGIWFRESDDRADAFFQPVRQTYLLLMVNEISTLKRQQEEIRTNAMRALIAEQERVRSMREALQAAIFQMQQPLNLIAAANEMLERRRSSPELAPLRSVLGQALASGRDALEKLENSIPIMPPEAIAPVNINQLLREVLTLSTQRLLAGGIVVEWQPAPVLPAVLGREGRLRGMFKQLIDNAMDAMEHCRSQRRDLRIVTKVQENAVVILIEDTGPGVPKELHWKIFEPFYTSKPAGDRTGIGLALAQEVVNEQRGMIGIDPEYTDGCRVRVLLPLDHDGGFEE
ncbi:MAG: nitrogen fixation negative regulator NifL [Candidatus Competibacteraceae bacterium]